METQESLTFLQQILGTTDTATFSANAFFALVGALISLLVHANTRDKDGTDIQSQFSWKVLLQSNVQRIGLNILLVYVSLRFCEDLTGWELTPIVALGIGVSYDQLGALLKRFNILDKRKEGVASSDDKPKV